MCDVQAHQAAIQAQAGRYAAALAQLERVTAERDKAVAENVGLRKKARLAEMSRGSGCSTAEAQRHRSMEGVSSHEARVSLAVNRQAERRARPHRHAAARVRPVDRGDHASLVWRDVGGARCRRGGLEEQASQQPHPAHDGHPHKLSTPDDSFTTPLAVTLCPSTRRSSTSSTPKTTSG